MTNQKPEGSSPSNLSVMPHLSTYAQAVRIEQMVLGVMWEHFPRAAIKVVAAMDPLDLNWHIHVGMKDQVHTFQIKPDLTDWHELWSMITQIKLQS